jgi:hypothetical protein
MMEPLENGRLETLPAEIVDLIMDNLLQHADQKEARKALLSCSLISKALCVQVYSSLFEEIKISIRPTTPHTAWRDVMRTTRDVLVTGLDFPVLGMVYRIKSFCIEIHVVATGNKFLSIANDPNFSGLLDALHGPRHGISNLDLSITINDEPVPWRNLLPRFTTAFYSLCSSPRLHSLKLAHFTMVPRFLLTGTNIQHLCLHDVNFGRRRIDIDTNASEHPNIRQLRTISFLDPWNFDTLFELMAFGFFCAPEKHHGTAFANLESLTVGDRSPEQLLRNLPSLRSLKHFGVTHSLQRKWRRDAQAVNHIHHTLLRFIPGPSLLTLSIKIELPYSISVEDNLDSIHTPNPGWSDLDSVLLEPRFDHVQNISLTVHFFSLPKTNRPTDAMAKAFCTRCHAIIQRNLPGLIALRPTAFTLTILLDQPEDSLKSIQRRGATTGWW